MLDLPTIKTCREVEGRSHHACYDIYMIIMRYHYLLNYYITNCILIIIVYQVPVFIFIVCYINKFIIYLYLFIYKLTTLRVITEYPSIIGEYKFTLCEHSIPSMCVRVDSGAW